MLWGRYAARRSEARFSTLWDRRQWSVCPSIQGPAGLRLWDTSQFARHGTLTNVNLATVWSRSNGLYSLDFDGTDDHVRGTGNMQVQQGMSVALWFRAKNTGKRIHSLWTNGDSFAPDYYVHIEQVSGTTYQQNTYIGNGYVGAGTSFTLDTAWHHYGFVLSADNVIKYYRDGLPTGTIANTRTITQLNSVWCIGAIPGLIGAGFTAQGEVDDACRWGRELTSGEFRTLARRRGISYEMRRDMVEGSSGFQAAWARRQSQIIGGGT